MPSPLFKKPAFWLSLAAVAGGGTLALSLSRAPAKPPGDVTMEVTKRVERADDGSRLPANDRERRYLFPVTMTQPSLGPEDALVTVVSYCGFFTDACRRAEPVQRALLEEYDGLVRFVFRALPESREATPVYILAQGVHLEDEKYFEVRERMLAVDPEHIPAPNDLEPIVREVGAEWTSLVQMSKRYTAYIEADTRFAKQFGVAEPQYFVNGKRLLVGNPRTLKRRLSHKIEEEYRHAQQVAAAGPTRKGIYSAVVHDGYWGVDDDPTARARAEAEHEKKKLAEAHQESP